MLLNSVQPRRTYISPRSEFSNVLFPLFCWPATQMHTHFCFKNFDAASNSSWQSVTSVVSFVRRSLNIYRRTKIYKGLKSLSQSRCSHAVYLYSKLDLIYLKVYIHLRCSLFSIFFHVARLILSRPCLLLLPMHTQ